MKNSQEKSEYYLREIDNLKKKLSSKGKGPVRVGITQAEFENRVAEEKNLMQRRLEGEIERIRSENEVEKEEIKQALREEFDRDMERRLDEARQEGAMAQLDAMEVPEETAGEIPPDPDEVIKAEVERHIERWVRKARKSFDAALKQGIEEKNRQWQQHVHETDGKWQEAVNRMKSEAASNPVVQGLQLELQRLKQEMQDRGHEVQRVQAELARVGGLARQEIERLVALGNRVTAESATKDQAIAQFKQKLETGHPPSSQDSLRFQQDMSKALGDEDPKIEQLERRLQIADESNQHAKGASQEMERVAKVAKVKDQRVEKLQREMAKAAMVKDQRVEELQREMAKAATVKDRRIQELQREMKEVASGRDEEIHRLQEKMSNLQKDKDEEI